MAEYGIRAPWFGNKFALHFNRIKFDVLDIESGVTIATEKGECKKLVIMYPCIIILCLDIPKCPLKDILSLHDVNDQIYVLLRTREHGTEGEFIRFQVLLLKLAIVRDASLEEKLVSSLVVDHLVPTPESSVHGEHMP